MQAIQSRYLSATNYRGNRIKAWCERGSVTVPHPQELKECEDCHRYAVDALLAKFAKEDVAKYGGNSEDHHWAIRCGKGYVSGCLPQGDWAHVFIL